MNTLIIGLSLVALTVAKSSSDAVPGSYDGFSAVLSGNGEFCDLDLTVVSTDAISFSSGRGDDIAIVVVKAEKDTALQSVVKGNEKGFYCKLMYWPNPSGPGAIVGEDNYVACGGAEVVSYSVVLTPWVKDVDYKLSTGCSGTFSNLNELTGCKISIHTKHFVADSDQELYELLLHN